MGEMVHVGWIVFFQKCHMYTLYWLKRFDSLNPMVRLDMYLTIITIVMVIITIVIILDGDSWLTKIMTMNGKYDFNQNYYYMVGAMSPLWLHSHVVVNYSYDYIYSHICSHEYHLLA
jgi:hypothetical protein